MMESVIPTDFELQPKENFPFPYPFSLSSMERAWCMHDPAKIVYIKRAHLEKNLESMGLDMDGEQKKFLDYWCSPSTRDPETIRAELDPCFNLRQRAESWMERATPQKQEHKSRAQQFAENSRLYNDLMDELYGSSIPGATDGSTDYTDEQ